MNDKPIEWIGAAKKDLMDFPADARRQAGFELRSIQQGDLPSDFKPMSIVGKGAAFLFGGSPRIKKRQDSGGDPHSD